METGGEKINKIKIYNCGYCTNNMKSIIKGFKSEKRKFYARAVLINHKNYGNILYDTGYSSLNFSKKPVSILYQIFNPFVCNHNNEITYQLTKDNIDHKTIKNIILSHTHPDHIGGLKLLEDYNLITSEKIFDELTNIKLKFLTFKWLVPKKFKKIILLDISKPHFLNKYFENIYDLFEDGSILLIELNGHAKGQLGMFIPSKNIFFVSDAFWSSDLLKYIDDMKWFPKKIQNNFYEYKKTIGNIMNFSRDFKEVNIISSHEKNIGGSYFE